MEQVDVLGLRLEEALFKLESLGYAFSILQTKPIRGEEIKGTCRVVKQEYSHEQCTLTVCNVPDSYL